MNPQVMVMGERTDMRQVAEDLVDLESGEWTDRHQALADRIDAVVSAGKQREQRAADECWLSNAGARVRARQLRGAERQRRDPTGFGRAWDKFMKEA